MKKAKMCSLARKTRFALRRIANRCLLDVYAGGPSFLSCDEVCGISSLCCDVGIRPACSCCNTVDPDLDPRDRIRHAGFLVLSCVGPATCHKSSTVVDEQCSTQFWQPGGFFNFPTHDCLFVFLRGSVSTAPKCSIAFEALFAAVLSVLLGGGVSRDHEYMWLSESGVSPAHLGLA